MDWYVEEANLEGLIELFYPEACCSHKEVNNKDRSAEWEEQELGEGITEGEAGQGIDRLEVGGKQEDVVREEG